jgi:N-acetylmuramoyl-L-alanine amidase
MPIVIIIAAAAALACVMLSKAAPEPNADQLAEELLTVQNNTLIAKTTGDFTGIAMRPSPNKGSRGSAKVTTLVWHYTAGAGAQGAIAWLCDPAAKASAHFVVGRDGTITQLVPCAEAAWHAGGSTVTNGSSIGIECVSPGIVTRDDDGNWLLPNKSKWTPDAEPQQATLRYPSGKVITAWWVPYTPAQVAGMVALKSILAGSTWADCLNDQCGHEDVDPNRKSDPGPLFPWDAVSTFEQRKRRHGTTVQGVV